MRTSPAAVSLGAAAALLVGGCTQVEQAVEEASERAHEVAETARYCVEAIDVAQAIADRDVEAAVAAGEELVEVAPEELADDAHLLLDAARRAQDGELSALEEPEVVAAAERLRTATEQTCSPAG